MLLLLVYALESGSGINKEHWSLQNSYWDDPETGTMFVIAEKMFTSKSAIVRLQKEHCDIDKSLKADIQESLCLKLLQQSSRWNLLHMIPMQCRFAWHIFVRSDSGVLKSCLICKTLFINLLRQLVSQTPSIVFKSSKWAFFFYG